MVGIYTQKEYSSSAIAHTHFKALLIDMLRLRQ